MGNFPSAAGLEKLALDRMEDARALLAAARYDGAIYACGYAVELALKTRICKYLGWEKFDVSVLRSHDLELLLRFTGLENTKNSFAVHWNPFSVWDPQMRYDEVKSYQEPEAAGLLHSAQELMKVFL